MGRLYHSSQYVLPHGFGFSKFSISLTQQIIQLYDLMAKYFCVLTTNNILS